MTTPSNHLVMTYFQAWQNHAWDDMYDCLSTDFRMDGGQIQFPNRDAFIDFCKNGPSWKKAKLIDALFLENKAALLYEGITATGEKIRIAEFLTFNKNKITQSTVAISLA
jgi:hypothetical protein